MSSSILADAFDHHVWATLTLLDACASLSAEQFHGTDHRSRVCTALTSLGIQAPEIDAWDYAWSQGRLVEEPATT